MELAMWLIYKEQTVIEIKAPEQRTEFRDDGVG